MEKGIQALLLSIFVLFNVVEGNEPGDIGQVRFFVPGVGWVIDFPDGSRLHLNPPPSFQPRTLGPGGRVNYRRVILDSSFRSRIGVADIQSLASGELRSLATFEVARRIKGETMDSYRAKIDILQSRAQEKMEALFSDEENLRILAGSYQRFIAEEGLLELIQLPAVQKKMSLGEEDLKFVSKRFSEADKAYDKKLTDLLSERFEELIETGGEDFRRGLYDLVDFNGKGEVPHCLLLPLLDRDSAILKQDAGIMLRQLGSSSLPLTPNLTSALNWDSRRKQPKLPPAEFKKLESRGLLKANSTQGLREIKARNSKIEEVIGGELAKSFVSAHWKRRFTALSYVQMLGMTDLHPYLRVSDATKRKKIVARAKQLAESLEEQILLLQSERMDSVKLDLADRFPKLMRILGGTEG